MSQQEMEVWQEIAKNADHGAERLVAEYGDRLYAAASLMCVAIMNFAKPAVASRDVKPALMAATAPTNETVKVSYLMLLGYLRECFIRPRSARRKEEE